MIDNEWELDREDRNRLFWGVAWQRAKLFSGLNLDLFVYGLNEDDESRPSADRELFAPGLRLNLPATAGRLDFELEGAYRWGSRSRDTNPMSDRLDVRAYMLHAELGIQFQQQLADSGWLRI